MVRLGVDRCCSFISVENTYTKFCDMKNCSRIVPEVSIIVHDLFSCLGCGESNIPGSRGYLPAQIIIRWVSLDVEARAFWVCDIKLDVSSKKVQQYASDIHTDWSLTSRISTSLFSHITGMLTVAFGKQTNSLRALLYSLRYAFLQIKANDPQASKTKKLIQPHESNSFCKWCHSSYYRSSWGLFDAG